MFMQNTKAHEVLCWKPQKFYIFLHIYDPLCILYWALIFDLFFIFAIAYKIVNVIHI